MRRPLLALLATSALCATIPLASAQDNPAKTPSSSAHIHPTASEAGVSVAATPAVVNTLNEALKLAYWNNPILLAQRAQLRSTDFRLPQARSGYGPRLGVTGSYGYQRDNFEMGAGGYTAFSGWTATAAAVISQPLYTFGRTSAAERRAQAEISFGRNSLRDTEARVMFDTIAAYSLLVRNADGVVIAQDNLALLQREFTDTAIRLKAHETTITDYHQVQTRIELGKAELHVAQEQFASSRAQFLRMVGALPGNITAPPPFKLPVATLEEAYAFAERNNPVLAAAYSREQVSRAVLSAAKADMMPQIELRGRAETGTITPYDNDLRQTTLRGEVLVSSPIFESGLRRARVDEAREANDADWRLIDAALRDNRTEVASAWNTMASQRAAIMELRTAVDAAEQAYDGALQQERAGMRTTLDVLDLARDLLTVRVSLNRAITEAYVAEARLLAAMGSLEGLYLLPDVPLYDPEVHYADARNNGDVPLLTPLVRALDGIGQTAKPSDRPIRDPARQLVAPGVDLTFTPSSANCATDGTCPTYPPAP